MDGRDGTGSALLAPLGAGYGVLMGLRNWAYDQGVLPVRRVGAPVLSVGNLSAGGTGKTPMVEFLLRLLLPSLPTVAVVSRGYGREGSEPVVVSEGGGPLCDPGRSGDEPYQIARKFPRAVVLVDADRVRAARTAVERYGARCVLMDDGFQHRALGRDCDIVLVDANRPLRSMRMLPAGLRREALSGLGRAGVIVYTRCADPAHAHEEFPEAPRSLRCCVRSVVAGLRRISDGAPLDRASLSGAKVVAFCGIGEPASFRRTVESLGAEVTAFETYPDHHRYAPHDLRPVTDALERSPGATVVTTEKDAVRIAGDPRVSALLGANGAYVEIVHEFLRGEEEFLSLVRAVAAGGRAA